MAKRYKVLIAVIIFLQIIYFLPYLPPIRNWMAHRLVLVISEAGYKVDYSGYPSGNIWTNTGFDFVSLEGNGLDVSAQKIKLRYFLPNLIKKKFTLNLDIDNAFGEINWQELEFSDKKAVIALDLKTIKLRNSALAIRDLPYTIPDLSIRSLNIKTLVDKYQVLGLVASKDGSVEVDAVLRLEPLQIDAKFKDLDLRIGRHWWGGLESGNASGNVIYNKGKLTGKAQVENGELRFLNTDVKAINGEVKLNYPNVFLNLNGETIAGNIKANGKVAIAEQQWMGDIEGKFPLKDAAIWIAKDRINVDLSNWELLGEVDTKARVKGWRAVNVVGRAATTGSLQGREIKELKAVYSYASFEGIRVSIFGNIADGDIEAELNPIENGLEFALSAKNLVWLEKSKTQVDFYFDTANRANTSLVVNTNIKRAGRDIDIIANTILDNNVWRAELKASDDLEETMTGRLSYQKQIDSEIHLQDLKLPYFANDAQADVILSGQLGDLLMDADIYRDTELSFVQENLQVNEDFAGNIKTRITYDSFEEVIANLGPLSLSGHSDMSFQNGAYKFELSPSQYSAVAIGELTAKRGLLLIDDGKYDVAAEVTADFESKGVISDIAGFASFDNKLNNKFRFLSPALKLSSNAGVWAFDFDNYELAVYGQDVVLSGQAELSSLEDFNLGLSINSEYGDLLLNGPAEDLSFVLNSFETEFVGRVDFIEKNFKASAKVADLDLNIAGLLGADGLEARALLTNNQEELVLLLNGPLDINKLKFDLSGEIELQNALNLAHNYSFLNDLDLNSAAGILKPELSYQNSIASGNIAFKGSYLNYPLKLNAIVSRNVELNYSGQTTVQGQIIDLSGQVYPEQNLLASNDLGNIDVLRDESGKFVVSGQGKSPEYNFSDWTIAANNWSLVGDLQELDLKLGESKLKINILDSGWQLAAQINEQAKQAEKGIALLADFKASGSNPDGEILGVVKYFDQESLELDIAGSLESIDFAKNIKAKDLLAMAGFDLELLGDLKLSGNIKPKTQDYSIKGSWLAGSEQMALELSGKGIKWQARAYNPNIQADYQANQLSLELNNFNPSGFIANYPQGYNLSGQMNYQKETAWSGSFNTSNSLNFNNIEIPLNLTAIGAGKTINLAGQTKIQNKEISFSGEIYPKIDLKASNELGEIFLKREQNEFKLSGAGRIAEIVNQNWLSNAHGWFLTGDLQDVHINIGESEFDFSRQESNWQLSASLNEKISQGDKEIVLLADLDLSNQNPNGELLGSLNYKANDNYLELPISGSLKSIDFVTNKSAKELLTLAGFDFGVLGDIELAGNINPKTQVYNVSGFWLAGEDQIALELSGKASEWQARAYSNNLQASYQGNSLQLEFLDFKAANLLANLKTDAILNGSLNFDLANKTWQGSIATNLNQPVKSQFELVAQEEKLMLFGDMQQANIKLNYQGELWPQLNIVLASDSAEYGELQGVITGSLGQPYASGSIVTKELLFEDGLKASLEAQSFTWASQPLEGKYFELLSELGSLSISKENLSGNFELAMSIEEKEHLLKIDILGSISEPIVQAYIEGEVISGPIDYQEKELTSNFSLDPSYWLQNLGKELAVEVSAEKEGKDTRIQISTNIAGEDISLDTLFEGGLNNNSGQGNIVFANQEIAISFYNSLGKLELNSKLEDFDLASLNIFAPVGISGLINGDISFNNETGLDFNIDVQGQLRSQDFDFYVNYQEKQLFINGQAAKNKFNFQTIGAGRYHLATSPDSKNNIALDINLSYQEQFDLLANGKINNEEILLNASFNPKEFKGDWQLSLVSLIWRGDLERRSDNWQLNSQLNDTEGYFRDIPITNNLRISLADGQILLDSFDSVANYQGQEIKLQASGQVWPKMDLQGLAHLDDYEFALVLKRSKDLFDFKVQYQQLSLLASINQSFLIEQAKLEGRAEHEFIGVLANLSSDISWDAQTGFSGLANIESSYRDYKASFELLGQRDLAVNAQLENKGLLADILLNISQNPLEDIGGSISARFDSSLFNYDNLGLDLTANIDISGKLLKPVLDGDLKSGKLKLEGRFNYDKAASFDLSNQDLSFVGSFDSSGIELNILADDYDLKEYISYFKEPHLNADVMIKKAWLEPIVVTSNKLILRLPNSQVSAEVSIDDGRNLRLNNDIDLQDIKIASLELFGKISGPIDLDFSDKNISRTELIGKLNISSLDYFNDASLLGEIDIAGSLASPTVSLNLSASGIASGGLEAIYKPKLGFYSVVSNLNIADYKSNFVLSLNDSGFEASGQMGFKDFKLFLSEDASAERVLLSGQDRLENWQASIDFRNKQMMINGQLASITSSLGGNLDLQASWSTNSNYWLKGSLLDIKALGIDLGSANLFLSQGDKKLSLNGEKIKANVLLEKPFSYEIEQLAASLNDSYFASLSGAGNLKESEFNLRINGNYAEQEFAVPFSLSYANRLLKMKTDSDIFNGRIILDAQADLDSGWQGDISLNSLTLAGAEISYQANIVGDISDPVISGDLSFSRNQALLEGVLQLSRFEVLLDQVLSYPKLKDNLNVQGKLWPKLNLNIFNTNSRLSLQDDDGALFARGRLELDLSLLNLDIEARQDFLDIAISFPKIKDLSFLTSLEASSLEELLLNIKNKGLHFQANNAASGSIDLRIKDKLSVSINDFVYQSEFGEFKLSGQLDEAKIWQGNLLASLERKGRLNWLPEIKYLDISLLGKEDYTFLVNSKDISFEIKVDEEFRTSIKAKTSRNQLISDLKFNRSSGFSGLFGFGYFLVYKQANSESRLNADFYVSNGEIVGSGELSVSGQKISFSEAWGLESFLPKFLNPISSDTKELDLRIDKLAFEDLPIFSNKPVYLEAPISGVLRLNRGQVIASFQSPNLKVLDNNLPFKLDLIGNLDKLELTGNIAKTTIAGEVYSDNIDLLLRLEHFPIEVIAESIVGNTNVNSSVTGILRFQSFFNDIKNADIRFASQQIVLEKNGIESIGNFSFSYQNQEFEIQEAEFFGAGHWLASGKVSEQELSLNINAQDADFNAIIALIPQFSIFDIGASGSLSFVSSGNLDNPNLEFESPALNISVANTDYLLSNANMALINDQLSANGKLLALSPIVGELDLTASGKIKLLPWRIDNFSLNFVSPSTQLTIGELKKLSGAISRNRNSNWQINAKGILGNEIKLSGSLNPFDINLFGQNLEIIAPRYFVAKARIDTNIDISYKRDFFIGGEIFTHEADLIMAGREKRAKQEPSRALERIHFDNLKVIAPQRLFLNEPIGSAEMSMDTIVTGTAAKLELRGRADTIRGDFRFSGRSFIIDSATAIFQRSRGIYPLINIQAHSSISKREILRGVEDRLSIIEPKTDTVEIFLNLVGSIDVSDNSAAAFSLGLVPDLSSNVVIQDLSYKNTRKLNNNELYSLLTLAKIELATNLSDTGGVAETALQGALDTAIDVLILSALQKEIGNALGFDIFEIRTTPFSALIDGQESFGVSLRIGAYIEDDVFASYSFSSQGFSSDYSLSHEFSIRYDLAPLSLELQGRLNFLQNDFYTPSPEFAVDLTYKFSELTFLELGFDLSNESQSVSFGVSFRW